MNPARRPYRNLANRSAPFGLAVLGFHGKKTAAQADCAAALIVSVNLRAGSEHEMVNIDAGNAHADHIPDLSEILQIPVKDGVRRVGFHGA